MMARLLPLLLLLPTLAHAQPTPRHVARELTVADGLPQGVGALAQDHDGLIWIGTRDGLARWDGARLHVYRHAPGGASETGLPSNVVRTLAVDSAGVLWVGTSRGLARFDRAHETFAPVRTDRACAGPVRHIAAFEGSLWTGGQRACRLDGARLVPHPGVPPSWRGIAVWTDGTHPPLATQMGTPLHACTLTPDGCDPAGTGSLGYAYLDGELFGTHNTMLMRSGQPFATLPALASNFSLTAGAPGELWLGTAEGLLGVDAATGRLRWAFRGGRTVSAVLHDADGRLWVGHSEGVTLLAPLGLAVRAPAPLPERRTNGLFATRDGRLFVATQSGLYERTLRGDVRHRLPGLAADAAVWWIDEDPDGTLYAGTKRSGLFVRAPGGAWRRDPRVSSLLSVRFTGRVGGERYVLASSGAFRLTAGGAVRIGAPAANFAARSADGRVWIATDAGVHAVLGDTLGPPVLRGIAWAIDRSADDALWVATVGSGLCRLTVEGVPAARCLTTADGLLANAVYGVRVVDGVVWASTDRGLARVDARALSVDVFTQADGLPGDAFDLMAHGRGRGDTLLFGGTWGYVAVEGTSARAATPRPRVLVSAVRVQDRPRPGLLASGDTLRLARGATTFALDLAAPGPSAPPAFAYRLTPFDEAWRTTAGGPATLAYAQLPPGAYRLEAHAGGPLLALTVDVAAAWWQTTWARVLAVLLVAGLAAGAFSARVQAERRRAREQLRVQRHLAEATERERLRVARDLHDGPMQTLYQIGHAIDRLAAAAPAVQPDAERARHLATGVAGELRGVVRALRPDPLGVLGLPASLTALARRFEERTGTAATVRLPDVLPPLTDAAAVALYRAAQEALANAERHAAADAVALRLSADARTVRLAVRDDGAGFAPPARLLELAREDHYGLLGAAERVAACGGALRVESAPGRGTTLVASVPVARAG